MQSLKRCRAELDKAGEELDAARDRWDKAKEKAQKLGQCAAIYSMLVEEATDLLSELADLCGEYAARHETYRSNSWWCRYSFSLLCLEITCWCNCRPVYKIDASTGETQSEYRATEEDQLEAEAVLRLEERRTISEGLCDTVQKLYKRLAVGKRPQLGPKPLTPVIEN